MGDRYIDVDELSIYGPYASRQIRRQAVGLVSALDAGMSYLADEIDAATATAKTAVDASRTTAAGVRDTTRRKEPVKGQAKTLLGRFSKHLSSHEKGTVDRKVYFTRDGTAGGVGGSASKLLLAVTHIAAELSREGCPVRSREEWLAEFRAVGAAFAPAVEHSNDARTDRSAVTPEMEMARQAWLQTYAASKAGVECVLRLTGRLHRMPAIFHDLAVPAGAKVTEIPPDPPDEPADETPPTD